MTGHLANEKMQYFTPPQLVKCCHSQPSNFPLKFMANVVVAEDKFEEFVGSWREARGQEREIVFLQHVQQRVDGGS